MLSDTISRIRRNHGLEHATIHVLSEHHKGFSAQGNSTHRGFFLNIYGDISEADVVSAVEEAYRRMKGGEEQLALHPNCGTVLLTAATMAVLAAQATFSLEQLRQRRSGLTLSVVINALPTAVLAAAIALIASRPLGMALQAGLTVDGNLGNLQVISIRRISASPITRLFQFLLGHGRSSHVQAFQIETAE